MIMRLIILVIDLFGSQLIFIQYTSQISMR